MNREPTPTHARVAALMERRATNHQDVIDAYKRFCFPLPGVPTPLSDDVRLLRLRHIMEEIGELTEGFYTGDLAKQADALVDIVYLCHGTAALMGLPWQALWDAVHMANVRKERATPTNLSKRASAFDLVKPEGWRPPQIAAILAAHGARLP